MKIARCFGCMAETQGYPCLRCGYDPENGNMEPYVLRPGTILNGKYLVGKVLGQGGFGITYIGFDLALERKVAIKEYYPSGQVIRDCRISNILQWCTPAQAANQGKGGREIFLKEARKMSKFGQVANVVRVQDVFQENDTAYIVMDLIEGQTLKQQIGQSGPIPWEKAKGIFFPVMEAMEQVHQAGLIHRDLSPDNLMIQPDGMVKILDLGAAKDLSLHSGASSMVVAKGGFSPLEQYTQRGGSGPWTDVYALAATIYWSLTGVVPVTAIDRMERDNLRWDLPQLLQLPPQIRRALQKAMALRAQDRIQTMAEFAAAMKEMGTVKTRRSWLLPGIAAVGAICVLGLVLLGTRDVPQTTDPTTPVLKLEVQTEPAEAVPTVIPLPIPEETAPTKQYIAIDCGKKHTVILYNDGTVKAVGDNRKGQCDVDSWQDIVQISTRGDFTVGLKADGTVVATGDNTYGQCDVASWMEIVQISASAEHTVGLRADGTVLSAGDNENGECDVYEWRGVTSVSAGDTHTVALMQDGTVIAVGKNEDHRIDVGTWRNVETICTGAWNTIGLKKDGTILYCGNGGGPDWRDADNWKNIVMVAAGNMFTVALDESGNVHYGGVNDVGQSEANGWTDITYIAAGPQHILGVKRDGTCVSAGRNDYGQGTLSREDLFG